MKGILIVFAVIVSSLFSLMAGAATIAGTITDATTGQPIPSATVFVYWGHTAHPFSTIVVVGDWWSCDGTASAVSDAAGRYQIVLPLMTSLHRFGDLAPQVSVVAQRYFDDRAFYVPSYSSGVDGVMQSIRTGAPAWQSLI
jgi:hypothetical protein